MSTDPNAAAEKTDQASTKLLPKHPKATPEEIAQMMDGEEEAVQAIAASLRNQVEEYGPCEVELDGQIFTVWVEDDPEPGS